MMNYTRLVPIDPLKTTILLVDVQNSEINSEHREKHPWYCTQILEHCLPNMTKLIQIARPLGVEIMYTTIENLTEDGRDRSLDHKLSNIFIAKGSRDAQVIDVVAPGKDDIWLKKTSSGVFNSTNIDYILRNIGCQFLVVVGFLTDQCVDMAVRDGADRGYHVICLSDACATHTKERHDNALKAFGGYCRIMTTDDFINEIQKKHQPQLSIQPMSLTTFVTTDLAGITRGRSIPTKALNQYLTTGCGWVPANSSLTPQDSMADDEPWGSHGDLRLLPSINSRVHLMHGPRLNSLPFDFIHCNIIETNGQPWPVCPRTFLSQELQRYHDLFGFQVFAAFEHEFSLSGRSFHDRLPSFSLRAQSNVSDFAGWLMSSLENAGVQPEMFLPEFGENQYEITCQPTFGVDIADRAVNIREITHYIAGQLDLHASFSPKTKPNGTGNGVHLHISLKNSQNQSVFYEAGRPYDLSEIGEFWISGIIDHLPALCAITAPTPVSYLRLQPHSWSSAYTCYGNRNREASIRLCPTTTLSNKSLSDQYNIEFRPLDATASPHFSLASILVAGRLGIQRQKKSVSIANTDPHLMTIDERHKRNITALPSSLTAALDQLMQDHDLLGEFPKPLIETYVSMKRHEIKITQSMDSTALCEHYSRIY